MKENKSLCRLMEFQRMLEQAVSTSKNKGETVAKSNSIEVDKTNSDQLVKQMNKLQEEIKEGTSRTRECKNSLIKTIKHREKLQKLFKIIFAELHKRIGDLENVSMIESKKGNRKNFDQLCEMTEVEQALQFCYDSIFKEKKTQNTIVKYDNL